MQVQLQPSYILHTRPYRDTSLLVEALTRDHGRLTLVARGQRQSRQKARRPLQAFTLLLLSWQGRSDLKTLTGAEIQGTAAFLSGNYLYSGLYANELLMRLLPQGEGHDQSFDAYRHLLAELLEGRELEAGLRRFEFRLLDEMGYGIDFSLDANSGNPLSGEKIYQYLSEVGFLEVEANSAPAATAFVGRDLQAIAVSDYSQKETLRAAKRLARLALAPHLGSRPLKSRELFR